MSERKVSLNRKTAETNVQVDLNIDGTGIFDINSGFKFIDHMLTILSRHSEIDLMVKAEGDLTHHVIEDIGIVLGQAFLGALGDKKGINRYGFAYIPMDESLARCALDFSGRKSLAIDLKLTDCGIEDVAIEDIHHFINSFAENAKMNLHLHVLYGEDQHHKVEAAFKALAKSIKDAIKVFSERIPSTKGII